ncbi:MAG: YicC family protein [Cyclobacteriaceae bacterium]|nr:YicC family protein [Cyclobacteriaceae bacterium]
MIYSMTGFGSSEEVTPTYSLRVEIKTLNSKFFDLSLKIPKEFNAWEMEIKGLLEKGLKRGKVNFTLEFTPVSWTEPPVHIDEGLFVTFFERFRSLAERVNSTENDLFKLALYAPGVMVARENLDGLIQWASVCKTIQLAIEKCNAFRKEEGRNLETALITAKQQIANGLEQVKELDPKRIQTIRDRIKNSLAEIEDKTKSDPNRFEQELIYYLEKLDISEEKVRLASHLEFFDSVLADEEANGKKLGFLTQELGREINTIGSKANDAEIQRSVIRMKEELEKIKEQILNVL